MNHDENFVGLFAWLFVYFLHAKNNCSYFLCFKWILDDPFFCTSQNSKSGNTTEIKTQLIWLNLPPRRTISFPWTHIKSTKTRETDKKRKIPLFLQNPLRKKKKKNWQQILFAVKGNTVIQTNNNNSSNNNSRECGVKTTICVKLNQEAPSSKII